MILTKDRSFYRSLFLLAIPIALQNLITFAVTLADNVMVGALGDNAISGVYIGSQIQTLLQIFTAGIEGAVLVLCAQYWGKRDLAAIKKVVSVGLATACLSAVVISIACLTFTRPILSLFAENDAILDLGVTYLRITVFSFLFFCLTQGMIAALRSVEKPRIGMVVSLVSLTVNVSLNYILIFGKLGFSPMGVKGAAIATLISRIAEFLVIFVYTFFIDKKLGFRFADILKFDRALTRDFFRYGAPIMAGQLIWAVNMFSYSAIMGKLPFDGVIAALSVAGTLNSLSYVVMNGMAGAVGIITGKTIGSGNTEKIREYAYTVQVIFLILGILTGALLFAIKSPFISLYNISPEATVQAESLISVLSFTIVGTCYQAACLFGLVKSGGDVSFVMKNDAFFVFLVVLPSALLAARLGAAPWLVFLFLKSDQILKCFVAFIKINRFKWMKNLTKSSEISQER
ncbi:MAG: MATE family efflux transporter [Clostridia bacterium]|nr:MATE family efflux transporter [Clostridia bacterium]